MAGIYIHVPFCIQKCFYCAFHSMPASASMMMRYFNALRSEIDSWRDREKPKINTIYFGGGTPSFPDEMEIKKTLEQLGDVFEFDPHDPMMEKTIEVNPASALADKLQAYASMGFNRLSIGLQAGQDRLLKRIGRAHSVKNFCITMDAASEYFDNISADLIFGLPEQTLTDVRETIELITAYPAIKHLSCYSLSVEPGTVFEEQQHEGRLILPSEETERAMYSLIRDAMKKKGFIQYEISNFACPGYESRHNSSYWNLTPYIGFGSGAASYYNRKRTTNTTDIQTYITAMNAGNEVFEEDHLLTLEEQKGDFMFLGLRKIAGVKDPDYQKIFGSSFYDDYPAEINDLKTKGLIVDFGSGIRLSERGLDLANQVFMAFV